MSRDSVWLSLLDTALHIIDALKLLLDLESTDVIFLILRKFCTVESQLYVFWL